MTRRRKPTREGAVLRMFRDSLNLSTEVVAGKARVTVQTVRLWECGRMPLSRDRLVEVLGLLDVPSEAVEEAFLSQATGLPAAGPSLPTEPPREERTLIHRAGAAAGHRAAQATRTHLLAESHRETAREHRAWAVERWSRLAKRPADKQEKLIGALFGDEKSWALAERLCLASAAAAAHRASEALRLAQLAVRVAEHSPGPEPWLLRLLGWCLCFLANAIRVGGELSHANEVFARADDLWTRGVAGDPFGLLDGTHRLDLKASLLTFQGHFVEARHLLDEALVSVGGDHAQRGHLLIKKATNLGVVGEYEASLEVLLEAEPLIDEQQALRPLFLHRFTQVANLCHLDRFVAAEPLMVLVETLAANLGNELDQVRTGWLKGLTWAGLGRRAEALAILSRVRHYFRSKEIAHDFALVSQDVAVLQGTDQDRLLV